MKLKEYIECLQKLLNENGDLDVTVRVKHFHQNLDIDESYSSPDRPRFDKYKKCFVIHSSFIRDE